MELKELNEINIQEPELQKEDGDYINSEDGLLYCGKCHTRKEILLSYFGKRNCLCKCAKEKLAKETRERSLKNFINENEWNIDRNYRGRTFEQLDDCQTKVVALNYVNDFSKYLKANQGLYFYGEKGNGKTTITCAIADYLLHKGYRVLMTTMNNALDMFSPTMKFKQDDLNYEFQRKIDTFDLVILDDFGTSRDSEFQNERIYNLINARYESKKPLILTSNISWEEMKEASDNSNKSRTYDRILEICFPVSCKEKGRRLEMSKNHYLEIKNDLLKTPSKEERIKDETRNY